jgi:hypothetical protein
MLLISTAYAEFVMERVDVSINDIQADGSAKVHESIKFIIYGDYANSLYETGISSDQLSFWSSNLDLKDMKLHVSSSVVDVQDLRVRPQPSTQCNPIQKTCHGEIILDYTAAPLTNASSNSGLFTVEMYKPRTNRYTINSQALSFTTTTDGNIILDENVYLTIELPDGSSLLDANPQPTSQSDQSLTWTDIVLVKFSLIFDVEESIDKEVSDFFTTLITSTVATLQSPHGAALIILVILIIAAYSYIIMSKRRDEE